MSKVSVIMPVHNAEQYLIEAIESVLNQTYADFELFLINDRSTDRSVDICRKYCQNDKRIVLLENDSDIHGPGPTRNIGLEYATGEYIYFMDSDDWIDQNLLLFAVNRMEETYADIVQFGVVYERNGETNPDEYYWKGKELLSKDDIKLDFFGFWKNNRHSLWLYFFRREVVNNIRFESIIIGEDISYVMDALSNANEIAFIPKPLYHYRYVDASTSHRWNENAIECREVIWNHQHSFAESLRGDVDTFVYAEVAYTNYIWALYQLSSTQCPLSFTEKRRQILYLSKKMHFDDYRKAYPLKLQRGTQKIKYTLVKYHLEWIILLFGSVFLKFVRGE